MFHVKLDQILGEKAKECVEEYAKIFDCAPGVALVRVVRLSAGLDEYPEEMEKYTELMRCYFRQRGVELKEEVKEEIKEEEKEEEKKIGCDVCGSKGKRHKAGCPLSSSKKEPT